MFQNVNKNFFFSNSEIHRIKTKSLVVKHLGKFGKKRL
jgi:hypothetical protein